MKEKMKVFDALVEDILKTTMIPKITATTMINKIYMVLEDVKK